MGKSGPNATLNLFFLGLGWRWVGESVGFILLFMFFNPTEFGESQKPYLFDKMVATHRVRDKGTNATQWLIALDWLRVVSYTRIVHSSGPEPQCP